MLLCSLSKHSIQRSLLSVNILCKSLATCKLTIEDQCFHHVETSQFIFRHIAIDWFLLIETLILKELTAVIFSVKPIAWSKLKIQTFNLWTEFVYSQH